MINVDAFVLRIRFDRITRMLSTLPMRPNRNMSTRAISKVLKGVSTEFVACCVLVPKSRRMNRLVPFSQTNVWFAEVEDDIY